MSDVATVAGWFVLALGALLAALAVVALFAWGAVTLADRITQQSKLLYVLLQFMRAWYRLDKPTRHEAMERALRMAKRRDDRKRGICPDCGLSLEPVCTFCEMSHDQEPDHA